MLSGYFVFSRYDSVIGTLDEHDATCERIIEKHPVFGDGFGLGPFEEPPMGGGGSATASPSIGGGETTTTASAAAEVEEEEDTTEDILLGEDELMIQPLHQSSEDDNSDHTLWQDTESTGTQSFIHKST